MVSHPVLDSQIELKASLLNVDIHPGGNVSNMAYEINIKNSFTHFEVCQSPSQEYINERSF